MSVDLRAALEQIVALDFEKTARGGDDFYSGPSRFIQAWTIAANALGITQASEASREERTQSRQEDECDGCGCSRWACDAYRTSGKVCCPDCDHRKVWTQGQGTEEHDPRVDRETPQGSERLDLPRQPTVERIATREYWTRAHMARGHTVAKRDQFDECSCGATYWPEASQPATEKPRTPKVSLEFAKELLVESGRLRERALWTKSPRQHDELMAAAEFEKQRGVDAIALHLARPDLFPTAWEARAREGRDRYLSAERERDDLLRREAECHDIISELWAITDPDGRDVLMARVHRVLGADSPDGHCGNPECAKAAQVAKAREASKSDNGHTVSDGRE